MVLRGGGGGVGHEGEAAEGAGAVGREPEADAVLVEAVLAGEGRKLLALRILHQTDRACPVQNRTVENTIAQNSETQCSAVQHWAIPVRIQIPC